MSNSSAARSRILVVEDEYLIRMLLEECSPTSAMSVAAAVAPSRNDRIAPKGDFNAAVLDVNLDGQEIYPVAEILAKRGLPFDSSPGMARTACPGALSRSPGVSEDRSRSNSSRPRSTNPDHVRSAVLGGVGGRLVGGVGLQPDVIAQALEAPSLAEVTDPTGHAFRAFADLTRSDLRALAACMRGSRQPLERDALARIAVPVLVAAGTEDSVAGSPEELASLIPGAQGLSIPDRDHMLAVGDRALKASVLKFLAERP